MRTRSRVRILLIANPVPDYLQDAVYHGLVQILGHENVAEYPTNPRYHVPEGQEIRYPMVMMHDPEHPARPLDEWVRWADAIIIGSLRDEVYPVVRDLLARPKLPPLVFLDGEDDPYVREIRERVDVYFKREVLVGPFHHVTPFPLQKRHFRTHAPQLLGPLREAIAISRPGKLGIRPLPLGIVDKGLRYDHVPKRYDVAFMGLAISSPVRARVIEDLRALQRRGYEVYLAVADKPLPWRQYMETMAASRICISVRGAGWDTYRYWEIPYVGSLLLSQPLRILVPDDFEPGREAVYARPARIVEAARRLLAHDTSRIALAGRDKLMRHHTSVHRARVVLDAIEEALGRR